ncbi:MAG: cytochrome C peroxidase [Flavobacteriales bacterium]|nr:cytochrome C peroxidase [Flavobacteriales bacterium]
MNRKWIVLAGLVVVAITGLSWSDTEGNTAYEVEYKSRFLRLREGGLFLRRAIEENDLTTPEGLAKVNNALALARTDMKNADFWLRYLNPLAQKSINGPLPVEWETEVSEKDGKPYRRVGAGFTLVAGYLEEPDFQKDSLLRLVQAAIDGTDAFAADSTTTQLSEHHHFFLCNRLFLLNLAAIYTTGFECPDTSLVIPELRSMMTAVRGIYVSFNSSFPSTPVTETYLAKYDAAVAFANAQPSSPWRFDHFTFIQQYVNPLFAMNQGFINDYKVSSASFVDHALSDASTSIFAKDLYYAQDTKGIFRRVQDVGTLARIDALGKQLFFDPLLSGNNERSCASCHLADQFFADTTAVTAIKFDHQGKLARNTPSLVNAPMNQLLMLDGKLTTLQQQAMTVMAEPSEMGAVHGDVLAKVMNCPDYRTELQALLKATPQVKEVSMEHITSAITFYYGKFSAYRSPFDEAMDAGGTISPDAHAGFNLFMSKAQCATCHFVPQFNGVKPPFVGSEFEVLGTPSDSTGTALSNDLGRYGVNPAPETHRAFRTGSLRNNQYTGPYMHNGAFRTLDQVIDFYDAGGGAGHGLDVPNQTLSSDSLHLTPLEKRQLRIFMNSLTEAVPKETVPATLPASKNKALNARKPGGLY